MAGNNMEPNPVECRIADQEFPDQEYTARMLRLIAVLLAGILAAILAVGVFTPDARGDGDDGDAIPVSHGMIDGGPRTQIEIEDPNGR